MISRITLGTRLVPKSDPLPQHHENLAKHRKFVSSRSLRDSEEEPDWSVTRDRMRRFTGLSICYTGYA